MRTTFTALPSEYPQSSFLSSKSYIVDIIKGDMAIQIPVGYTLQSEIHVRPVAPAGVPCNPIFISASQLSSLPDGIGYINVEQGAQIIFDNTIKAHAKLSEVLKINQAITGPISIKYGRNFVEIGKNESSCNYEIKAPYALGAEPVLRIVPPSEQTQGGSLSSNLSEYCIYNNANKLMLPKNFQIKDQKIYHIDEKNKTEDLNGSQLCPTGFDIFIAKGCAVNLHDIKRCPSSFLSVEDRVVAGPTHIKHTSEHYLEEDWSQAIIGDIRL